jgi:hypothetical protein
MTATKALLSAAGLEDNLWCNVHSEPERIDAWTLDDISHGGHLYSLVDLPSGQRVNCGVLAVREDGKYGPVGMDYLDLYIPVEALMRTDPRIAAYDEFADDEESLAWRRPIDDWRAQLMIEVGRAVSFELATIGFEAYVREDYLTSDPQEDGPGDSCSRTAPTCPLRLRRSRTWPGSRQAGVRRQAQLPQRSKRGSLAVSSAQAFRRRDGRCRV